MFVTNLLSAMNLTILTSRVYLKIVNDNSLSGSPYLRELRNNVAIYPSQSG